MINEPRWKEEKKTKKIVEKRIGSGNRNNSINGNRYDPNETKFGISFEEVE